MVAAKETMEVKNLSLLVLLVVSFILFLIGISIPGRGNLLHIIFVAAGVSMEFVFYLLSFTQVLTLKNEMQIFWVVAIVCVPMIGNLIYIIVHDSLTRKQVPRMEV